MIRDEKKTTFSPMGLQYCEEATFSSLKKKRISPIHHKTWKHEVQKLFIRQWNSNALTFVENIVAAWWHIYQSLHPLSRTNGRDVDIFIISTTQYLFSCTASLISYVSSHSPAYFSFVLSSESISPPKTRSLSVLDGHDFLTFSRKKYKLDCYICTSREQKVICRSLKR